MTIVRRIRLGHAVVLVLFACVAAVGHFDLADLRGSYADFRGAAEMMALAAQVAAGPRGLVEAAGAATA